jgi:hypothetical protein
VVVLQEAMFPAGHVQVFGVFIHLPVHGSQESTVQEFPSSQFLSAYEQDPLALSHFGTTHKLLV